MSDALARHVAAAGHEVLVLTSAYRDAPAREERDGLRIVRLPSLVADLEDRLQLRHPVHGLAEEHATASSATARRVRPRRRAPTRTVLRPHLDELDLGSPPPCPDGAHGSHSFPEPVPESTRRLCGSPTTCVVRPFVRLGHPYVVPVDVFVHDYVKARFGIRGDRIVDIPVGIEVDTVPRDRSVGDSTTARHRRSPDGAFGRPCHPACGTGSHWSKRCPSSSPSTRSWL